VFENGKHIATVVKVPSEVTDAKWWPSESKKKKWEVHYLITKQIPLGIKGYFIPKGSTGVEYVDP